MRVPCCWGPAAAAKSVVQWPQQLQGFQMLPAVEALMPAVCLLRLNMQAGMHSELKFEKEAKHAEPAKKELNLQVVMQSELELLKKAHWK